MYGNRCKQAGGTLLGLVLGLILGLLIAAGVALFISKAPMPFMNKVTPVPEHKESALAKLPDPNQTLYSKDNLKTPEASATAPSANQDSSPTPADLPAAHTKQSFLQIGAYKTSDDAENSKAKLALLGFEAKIVSAEKDGAPLYRVRLGPYTAIDDVNRVRQRLIENSIDSAVVTVGQ